MKINRSILVIACVVQTACQAVATPAIQPSPTKINPTATLAPTATSQPTLAPSPTNTPALDPNLREWNGLYYDIRKWTVITYNATEWTPETYPASQLASVLKHKVIENCMMYVEEGRGMPSWTYEEVPVRIGGHDIFSKRIFQGSDGKEYFMVIAGTYHLDFPYDENKPDCVKDAERLVMSGWGSVCPSGNCGYCPGLPLTNLKIGDRVKLFNSEMALPVAEPDGNSPAGTKADWYFSAQDFTAEELQQFQDYNIEVIDGPVCANDNAWWQLKSPNDIVGWDSDDHFIIQP